MQVRYDRFFPTRRVSVITLIGLALWHAGFTTIVIAQPIPDDSLGSERSRVFQADDALFGIDGGARRGSNLFHSFREFGVEDENAVYFLNPDGVENIFSRVTGNNPSNILGTLGVFGGDANLFLINPNGILFGANASLDVQGSFTATTADAIRFADQGVFSALDPQVPSQLLSVNPSAFLFNQPNPGGIINRSVAYAGTIPPGIDLFGLRVPDGQNLALVGGNVRLEGGSRLFALGGRVDIGSIEGTGRVELNIDGSLTLPTTLKRDNVVLTDAAGITTRTLTSGGTIAITARTVTLAETSALRAGIFPGQGSPSSQAGDITLNATERVLMTGSSAIANVVFAEAIGNGGNIGITAPIVEILDTAQIDASTFGQGNAGNIIIAATDRVIFQGLNTTAFTTAEQTADGNGGNIEIMAPILDVLDGAQLQTSTNGRGDAGNVILLASNRITFSSGGALSRVETAGSGAGGNIEITAPVLELLDGAQLSLSTFGQGDAGSATLSATERITLSGGSGVLSRVNLGATGDAGDIEITVPTLDMREGAQLITSTFGDGNAGDIMITVSDRATFAGTSADGQIRSATSSSVEETGNGMGGNIVITAPVLEVLNGAQLQSLTRGQGRAGNVMLSATEQIVFQGTSRDGQFSSAAFSSVEEDGAGMGGDIIITAPVLEVLNGAQLSASTREQGNAGNIIIAASDRVVLDGVSSSGFSSGLFTSTATNSTGRGGRVTISTSEFRISSGAIINARTANDRPGGNITIRADQFTALNGGQIITTTLDRGRAGTIRINANRIHISGADPMIAQRLRESGRGNTLSEGSGESGLFANTRPASSGRGGSIILNTIDLQLADYARISAQSQGSGRAGGTDINASRDITLSNHATISTQSQGENALAGDIQITVGNTFSATNSDLTTAAANASGGNIHLRASDIRLFADSNILTRSAIDGGNITLVANTILAFADSDIVAAAGEQGGNINLDTPAFFGENYRPDATNAEPETLDGNDRVDVNARGELRSGTISTPDTSFVRDSLTDLPESAINTEGLIAESCVARSRRTSGTFIITGRGGLPERPGELHRSSYRTGEVRVIPEVDEPSWQMGDPIIEPQGMYELEDGRMILSRECN